MRYEPRTQRASSVATAATRPWPLPHATPMPAHMDACACTGTEVYVARPHAYKPTRTRPPTYQHTCHQPNRRRGREALERVVPVTLLSAILRVRPCLHDARANEAHAAGYLRGSARTVRVLELAHAWLGLGCGLGLGSRFRSGRLLLDELGHTGEERSTHAHHAHRSDARRAARPPTLHTDHRAEDRRLQQVEAQLQLLCQGDCSDTSTAESLKRLGPLWRPRGNAEARRAGAG